VVVMSHHRVQDFADGSPVTGDELAAVLEAAEGVVLHLVGHGHLNDAHAVPEPPVTTAEHGYWQLMLSSSVDFPSHSRIIEIVDEDNGYLSVYATNVGQNSPVDSLAHHGRDLSGAKRVFGTPRNKTPVDELWQQDLPAQNVLLRIPVPDAVRAELAQHSWPERIESEQTLPVLPGP
jgi:hypothetical protein